MPVEDLPEKINTKSHYNFTVLDKTILYESPRMRFSFIPMLNPTDTDHSTLKGDLYFERRKSENEGWPTEIDFTRGSVEPGKYVKFEFHNDELIKLFEYILSISNIKADYLKSIDTSYYRVNCNRKVLFEFVKNNTYLKYNDPNAYNLICNILSNSFGDFENIIASIVGSISNNQDKLDLLLQFIDVISKQDLKDIQHIVGQLSSESKWCLYNSIELDVLKQLKITLEEDIDKKYEEEHWQTIFKDNKWVLPHILPGSVIHFREKMNIGNCGYDGKGGECDFTMKDTLTNNALLVEIKKPDTPIISKNYYRKSIGVYSIPSTLSGAVVQVLEYRQGLVKTNSLKENYETESGNTNVIRAISPKCAIIIGRIQGLNPDQIKCFELYRNNISGVTIITYDEILERVNLLIDLLMKKDQIVNK